MTSTPEIVMLSFEDASRFVRNSKLIALRWDMIRWSLTFDMDAALDDTTEIMNRRLLIVLVGISDISLSLENARLPDGIVFTNCFQEPESNGGFQTYIFNISAPTFGSGKQILGNPHRKIVCRAERILCAISGKDDTSFRETYTDELFLRTLKKEVREI